MSKYTKRPAVIEAITFDELVQHGLKHAVSVHNGMPWSFDYMGHPITHENDDCYLIPTANGTAKLHRGDWLCSQDLGEKIDLWPVAGDVFARTYEPLATNEPPEPSGVEERLRSALASCSENYMECRYCAAADYAITDALALITSLKEDNDGLLSAQAVQNDYILKVESENAQLRGEVEGLQELVDEVAPFFARAIDLKPGSHPDYIGARYKETAANWMLKPKFSAYLAKLTGEEPSSEVAG